MNRVRIPAGWIQRHLPYITYLIVESDNLSDWIVKRVQEINQLGLKTNQHRKKDKFH